MLKLKNENIAIPFVLLAGILWSFGPLVVRHMDQPNLNPWQYLFARGIIIFLLLNVFLFFEEGIQFYKNYFKIGLSGIIGGSGLGVAMITFIWSITNTTAAITLLCLASMPFITALLGFLFLKEKITTNVWLSIVIATIGIVIMAFGDFEKGSLIGFMFGIISSIGFSVFSVTLRWRKETPKFTTVSFAGLFCAIVSAILIVDSQVSFTSTSLNQGLFAVHGTLVCLGLILYSIGSKAIAAAELTLLSLTEVVGGIFWVWLPIFGINEVPSNTTVIGGFLIFLAIVYYSLLDKNSKRIIALN
tara:strand:- start:142 stop:1047 length:906 start_codon:yes stop_codon:yes gene_type:complete